MRNSIIAYLIFSFCFGCKQSDIEKYVKTQTVPIESVSADFTSFDDLLPLKNAIGNSRIVMLGEQDHGDAPTFLAKTRIIKYLHEELGFNVLAFESDFYSLTEGWDQLAKKPGNIDTFLSKNIFSIWAKCDACTPLFYNYIPATAKTDNPLQIAGFDNQIFLSFAKNNLLTALDSVLINLQIFHTQTKDYKDSVLVGIDSLINAKYPLSSPFLSYIQEKLEFVSSEMRQKKYADEYWHIIIQNLIALSKQYSFYKNDFIKSNIVRDQQMAKNLEWIADKKYPNEKIIVWAANGHIMKNTDSINNKRIFLNMGTLFSRATKERFQTYVLGFTSFAGKAGRITQDDDIIVRNYPVNSFESWIDDKYDYAFVDFSKYNQSSDVHTESFFMKGAGHGFPINAKWSNMFDGIFFIREMYKCQPLQ